MVKELFGERKSNLEEEFFAKYNQELLQNIRKKGEVEARRTDLSRVSGITDEAVLDRLVDLEISGETLAALSLVPLVWVAWADGEMNDREHEAVLAAAEEGGLDKSHMGYRLLDSWLHHKPRPRMLSAWKEYVAALTASMEGDQREALRREVLGRARQVAEAAGGFLGLGRKVSDVEEKVLKDLASAFG